MGSSASAKIVYGLPFEHDSETIKDIARLFGQEIDYDFELDKVGLETAYSGVADYGDEEWVLYIEESEIWNYDYQVIALKPDMLTIKFEWFEKLAEVADHLGLDTANIGWYFTVNYG